MKTKQYKKPRVRVVVNDAFCDSLNTTSNVGTNDFAKKNSMTIPERALDKAIGMAKKVWDD